MKHQANQNLLQSLVCLAAIAVCTTAALDGRADLNKYTLDEPAIGYEITLVSDKRVDISLTFIGDSSGKSMVELVENWGGVENDGSDINKIEALGDHGNTLALERPRPYAWIVSHAPSERVRIKYQVAPTPERGDTRHGSDYRTRFRDNLFQMHANLGLLFPKHLDKPEPQNFSLRFVQFEKNGWKVACSFGFGEGEFRPHLPASRFRQSLLMAGNIRVYQPQIAGQTLCVAISGEDWGFEDEEFVGLATKIVKAERDFFGDHSDPWYMIALTPEGVASEGSFSLGGTAVTNCFALYCTKGMNLDPQSIYAHRIALLLAHEYFHTWNGLKIPTAEGQGETYWFSEGFTNYFARRILFQSGLFSTNQFTQDLNEALASYDSNPFKLAPNSRIRDEFWKNRDVGKLPYQRGDLIALMVDEHIRASSNNKKSLDDMIRALHAHHVDSKPLTTEQLLEFLANWVDDDVIDATKRIVLDGELVPVPEMVTNPNLQLAAGKIKSFDPGMDTQASQITGVVAGVREGSSAYRAGLRNGQKLTTFSIGSDPKPFAKVEIMVEGEPKSIEYEPVGEPRDVRVFKPKSNGPPN